jgi:RNA polymerase sigma-70 factor (ECF subfamily)
VIRTTPTNVDVAITTSDEELMVAVGGGARAPFEQLFERYRQPVWGFFRRRVRDPGVAEDLAQNVFTALLEAAPRYRAQGAFRSYLFAIAFNVLQAERRKQSSRAASPLDEKLSDPHALDADRTLWVRAALAQLDPDERELVMLREYEGLSYEEIAELKQLPLNSVRSRLFRARMALRGLLTADGEKEEQAR